MAANAWRILTEVRRKLDTEDWRVAARVADDLVQACSFAPGLDLGGGLDMDTWGRIDYAARAARSGLHSDVQHLRSVLNGAIWEVSWMQPFGCVEDIQSARTMVRVIQKLAKDYNATRRAA